MIHVVECVAWVAEREDVLTINFMGYLGLLSCTAADPTGTLQGTRDLYVQLYLIALLAPFLLPSLLL